jgi:hypothetical protein
MERYDRMDIGKLHRPRLLPDVQLQPERRKRRHDLRLRLERQHRMGERQPFRPHRMSRGTMHRQNNQRFAHGLAQSALRWLVAKRRMGRLDKLGWLQLRPDASGYRLLYTGFAWGHDVVGWLNTTLLRTGYEPCSISYTCNGDTIVYQSPQCNTSNLATCDAPSFCSAGSSICLLPPITFIQSGSNTGHLQVRPQLVRKGGVTKVFWNVGNVESCTVTSPNDSWTGKTSGPSGQTSNPIYQQTVFTLSCTGLGGSNIRKAATAGVVPVFREI